MVWDPKDPWSRKTDPIDDVLRQAQSQLRQMMPLRGLRSLLWILAAVILVWQGTFIVAPDEEGVVKRFGDRTLHHIAVRVEDIEVAMDRLKKAGARFAGPIVGARGGPLRQVFTVPEEIDGAAFSVVELTERHEGYQGFSPPQADSLMKSTVKKSGS